MSDPTVGAGIKAPAPTIVIPSFAIVGVQPPAQSYIGPSDFLEVDAAASSGAVTIKIQGRILRTDGQVSPFAYSFITTGIRTRTLTYFPLEEGFLLGLILFTDLVFYGQVTARVQLNKSGALATDFPYQMLIEGPIQSNFVRAWPPGNIDPTVGGQGAIYSVIGTAPLAGAEVSQTVPTNARWRLKGMAVNLTTSAAPANRAVTVVIDDGANVLAVFQAQTFQIASLTRTYHLDSSGGAADLTSTSIPVFMPVDLPMLAGWRIRTLTTNLQGADAYSTPVFYVEEWIDTK